MRTRLKLHVCSPNFRFLLRISQHAQPPIGRSHVSTHLCLSSWEVHSRQLAPHQGVEARRGHRHGYGVHSNCNTGSSMTGSSPTPSPSCFRSKVKGQCTFCQTHGGYYFWRSLVFGKVWWTKRLDSTWESTFERAKVKGQGSKVSLISPNISMWALCSFRMWHHTCTYTYAAARGCAYRWKLPAA